MVGTGIVIVLAAIYILMNAACIGYFARRRRHLRDQKDAPRRWNPVLHLILPLLGIATFVPAWLTAAGIRAFSFVAPLSPPVSYMGAGVGGWMVLGVLYLIYLRFHDPRRVTEVGLVHLEEEPAQDAE
jgi:purine-cytosine permease-like protein